jgi:hypothetical protein
VDLDAAVERARREGHDLVLQGLQVPLHALQVEVLKRWFCCDVNK